MRAALAIFVAVVQVAGPWLCCCGPAHAFAAVTAPVKSATETASGCPICAKLAAEKGQREAVAPAKPTPYSPCLPNPCQAGGVTLEAAPPATLETAVDSLLAFVAEIGFAPPTIQAFTPIAVAPPPVGVSELPFLPPGDRTRVHHVLHC